MATTFSLVAVDTATLNKSGFLSHDIKSCFSLNNFVHCFKWNNFFNIKNLAFRERTILKFFVEHFLILADPKISPEHLF